MSSNTKSRKKQSEADRIKEMEKAALNAAILKPFLETLFDDSKDAAPGTTARDADGKEKHSKYAEEEYALQPSIATTIGMSGMPSMRYTDALARETAKPFRLNTVVSIDAAPLPTRTAAPVYTELVQPRSGDPPQHAACLRHEYRESLRKSFTQVLRAATDTPTKAQTSHHEKDSNNNAGEEEEDKLFIESSAGIQAVSSFTGSARPPELYGQVKQSAMLQDAHLEFLMRTVNEVREAKKFRSFWGEQL